MLPIELTAKAIELCAALSAPAMVSSVSPVALYSINVLSGATLSRQPDNLADAIATVHDLIALGADFEAGSLGINGRDFARFGIAPETAFDPCALVPRTFTPPPLRIRN